MSLHASARSGQTSGRTFEMDKVMCLSRQKLRLESARGEPDLRKLLAHIGTVEHIQGWLRSHPPSRKAPLPEQALGLDDEESEMSPSSRRVDGEHSISHRWSSGDLRSTVTTVKEVGSDDDEVEDDSSDSDESWNGSDTSDDPIFESLASEPEFDQQDSPPAITVCRDFAIAESWTKMPKLLSVGQCRELATMICE